MNILVIPAVALAAAIAGGSSLLGGFFNRRAQKADRKHYEEYMHPAAQVERLQEAGLSPAMMYGGAGGGNSSVPPPADLGIGEAAKEGISAYVQTRMMKQSLQLTDAQIRAANAAADVAEIEAKWKKKAPIFSHNLPTQPLTNMEAGLELDQEIKMYNSWKNKNDYELGIIDREVKNELHSKGYLTQETINRVENIAANTGLTQLNSMSIEDQRKAMTKIIDYLEKGGLNLGEAIVLALIQMKTGR